MRFIAAYMLPLLLSACAGSANSDAEIVGPVWVAESIAGVPALSNSEVTLKFDADGRSGGKAGCNSYGAGYHRTGSALTFEQPFSTRMFCSPDELMAQEQAFLDLLSRVTGLSRTGDRLELHTEDGKTVVFHLKP